MRLASFTVTNFRSITRARKINMGPITVLIGPNNEGKSNIVRALAIGLAVLEKIDRYAVLHAQILHAPHSDDPTKTFAWARDYPVHRQERFPGGQTKIQLEFELTDSELSDFQERTGSRINRRLPIEIALGDNTLGVTVLKQGPHSKKINRQVTRIAAFVCQRLVFQIIPAVRTADSARDIVNRIVARELGELEHDDRFRRLLDDIENLQRPILDRIANGIRETLSGFLPLIEEVTLEPKRDARIRTLRTSTDVIINDGTRTSLKDKGDGVQSLVALGMMRHASQLRAGSQAVVLALEEPESHLHPDAIHSLRRVIEELSRDQQILITTHSPLFVYPSQASANIIVNRNQASAAKSVTEIRSALGVRAYDSLLHAEVVLVVEGTGDSRTLRVILASLSESVSAAFDDHRLTIDVLGGAGKLGYKVSLITGAVCQVHCFLDDDIAGRTAGEAAIRQGLLRGSDITYSICDGRKESEVEDLYDPSVYAGRIERDFGVRITASELRHGKKKWSDAIARLFRSQGKHWSEVVEDRVKEAVADEVVSLGDTALWSGRRSSVEALVRSLETLIRQARE